MACGYSQIPGVDFTESYAPVIHDVTWRLLLLNKLMNKHHAIVIDVKFAFLHGELEEDIFMECPEGLQNSEDECLLLNKALYGLVQAARQYYLKFISALWKIGFTGGDADP